jgi:hypothetical protein
VTGRSSPLPCFPYGHAAAADVPLCTWPHQNAVRMWMMTPWAETNN